MLRLIESADGWDGEIGSMIAKFLRELSEHDFELMTLYLLWSETGHTRTEQVGSILSRHKPLEVVVACDSAFTESSPSLAELERRLPNPYLYSSEYDARSAWLRSHASIEQLVRLAVTSGHAELLPDQPESSARWSDVRDYILLETVGKLVVELKPEDLRSAWQQVLDEEAVSSPSLAVAEVRAWAVARGIRVSKRGRVSRQVMRQYQAAVAS
ncbi:Lsr2 family DNA-binding protein [Fodinicola acaciae]|uniref:Lsr2 family DNA-binding protein n=1 Tax=Fodinicola acaciae TaxID=2681555 RepID=UPI001C9E40E1|nr:histone-like nucleoid-structuring protein Lsr2 [Fodinicola acaciae]